MIIHTQRTRDPFARVSKALLDDDQLSWKAKGILAYLSGKPERWKVRIDDLVKRSKDGRDAVYSAMKELRDAGYARLVIVHDKGRIVTKDWLVRTIYREDLLDEENPDQENPHSSKNDDDTNVSSNKTDRKRAVGFGLNGKSSDESPEAKFARQFFNFALQNRMLEGTAKPNFKNWKQAFAKLLETEEWDDINDTMGWYSDNWRSRWVPTCRSAVTFCQRFVDIKKAMDRTRDDEGYSEENPPKGRGEWTRK